MSKIIGVTVGTPLSANKIKEKIKPVTSVNGAKADEKGNVQLEVSGVYVGSGDMPAGYNVQIDPEGYGQAGLPCAAEVVDSLPTPEARLRGKFALVQENGEDQLYICLLTGGAHQWVGFSKTGAGGERSAVLGIAKLGKMILGRKE